MGLKWFNNISYTGNYQIDILLSEDGIQQGGELNGYIDEFRISHKAIYK